MSKMRYYKIDGNVFTPISKEKVLLCAFGKWEECVMSIQIFYNQQIVHFYSARSDMFHPIVPVNMVLCDKATQPISRLEVLLITGGTGPDEPKAER